MYRLSKDDVKLLNNLLLMKDLNPEDGYSKEKVIEYTKLLSQKKSSEVRLGQISEQLVPFLDKFKYDPKNAHFIGMPIDYIVFNNDEVIFVEVKSGESTLSKKQSEIKKLITDGKVRFETIRIN